MNFLVNSLLEGVELCGDFSGEFSRVFFSPSKSQQNRRPGKSPKKFTEKFLEKLTEKTKARSGANSERNSERHSEQRKAHSSLQQLTPKQSVVPRTVTHTAMPPESRNPKKAGGKKRAIPKGCVAIKQEESQEINPFLPCARTPDCFAVFLLGGSGHSKYGVRVEIAMTSSVCAKRKWRLQGPVQNASPLPRFFFECLKLEE